MSRYRCALSVFCENHSVLRTICQPACTAVLQRRLSKDSCTERDVFADSMCRSHFLVAFLFVGTDFNCFLKSIRRSIPMTVAVKLTSTRRCMTCSFFVTFFISLSERDLAVCAAVIVPLSERFAETRQRFRGHYTRDLISVFIRGLIQISNLTDRINYGCVTVTWCYRPAEVASAARRRRGERSRCVMWG